MARLVVKPVKGLVFSYIRAYRELSHNARTYLCSIVFQTVGASMIACVFSLYMKAAGLRESSLGYVEGAIALATAFVALAGPPLVATLGYRSLMLGALALLAVSRFSQALLPVAATLVALGAVVGLGDGFLRTVNSAFLAEHSREDQRTHLFTIEFVVRMLGVFIGAVLGGLLPSLIGGEAVAGFQWTMTAGSVVLAAGMLPMLRVQEQIHGIRGFWRVSLQSAREFSAWSHLLRLALPQSLLVAAGALTAPFVPLYLQSLGASVEIIGLVQGSCALVVGVAAFVTPVIRRRLGVGRGVTWLQVLAVPFLMAVPYVGSLVLGLLLLFARSTLMSGVAPLYSELSMESVSARDKPLVGGGLLFVLSIASFAGNALGGRLMEVSYTAPYLPAAAFYAAGTLLTYLIWVRLPKRKEARLQVEALDAA